LSGWKRVRWVLVVHRGGMARDLQAGPHAHAGHVISAVVTRRVLSRLFFSFVIAVTILLIVATSISVIIGLIWGPHEAAQDLETTIGGYWPLILFSIFVLTVALAAMPRNPAAT
jgi:hypothetical protein